MMTQGIYYYFDGHTVNCSKKKSDDKTRRLPRDRSKTKERYRIDGIRRCSYGITDYVLRI